MTPDATPTSTPAPQAAAPGSQPAPASPAAQPTPVQLLWEVARMAFVLMTRLIQVLQPIQSYYLNQSRQAMHVCTELCRVMLTIRFAPERITQTQLRHLTRARHIIQALFNYTLPLGPRASRPPYPTANQSPSASPLGARTPSSATTPSPAVAAVPEVPEVPGVPEVPEVPGGASSSTPMPVSYPTVARGPLPPAPSPTSHDSHSSQTSQSPQSAIPNPQSDIPHSAFRIQHSAFSPYIPDANTLVAAVRAATLPANCAGALLENPGEALVRALHELHAVYFSLYPNQPPTPVQPPSPSSSPSPSQSQSPSPSSGNPQSKGEDPVGLRDHNPQSDVYSVHSPTPSPAQSEIPHPDSATPHSAFPTPHSKGEDPVGLRDPIPHSFAPP